MKKLLIIAVILALVIVSFYLFLLPDQPKAKNEIEILLKNLERKTQIDFSKAKAEEFDWNVRTKDGISQLSISGQGFEASDVSAENYKKIESFFEENGFEADADNIADETVSGLAGYRFDSIACAIKSDSAGYQEMGKYDVAVKCGQSGEIKPISSQIAEVKTIEVDATENFSISLESNPTTGYQWEGDYNEEYLQFLGKEYLAQSSDLVGSGGNDVFRFVALKAGETEIVFSYLRLWEMKPISQAVYRVIIK